MGLGIVKGKALEGLDVFSDNLKCASDSPSALIFACGEGMRCSWQDGETLPAHALAQSGSFPRPGGSFARSARIAFFW